MTNPLNCPYSWNAKAVEVSDADGKIQGTELTLDIDVTNKTKMVESSIYMNPEQFRLQLTNGNNITADSINAVSVEPESTNSSTGNRFRLPAGTKPKTLNLFYDETRASVDLKMQ